MKRWAAALTLWLLLAYPLSIGPLNYAQGRGWIEPSANAAMQTFYGPLTYVATSETPLGDLVLAYADWFGRLATRRAASD